MHIDYNNWNERRSIMVKDQSECLALSPFDNKTMNIQDFSINQKNFQQVESVENDHDDKQTIPKDISIFNENKGVSSRYN